MKAYKIKRRLGSSPLVAATVVDIVLPKPKIPYVFWSKIHPPQLTERVGVLPVVEAERPVVAVPVVVRELVEAAAVDRSSVAG